jgi:hypothetical protein
MKTKKNQQVKKQNIATTRTKKSPATGTTILNGRDGKKIGRLSRSMDA